MSLQNDWNLFLIADGLNDGLPLAEVGGRDREVYSGSGREGTGGVNLSGASGSAELRNLQVAGGCAILGTSVCINRQLSSGQMSRRCDVQRNRGLCIAHRAPPSRLNASTS